MVFQLFSYRGLTTVLADLTNERSEAGEQNYGLNFIWTTHWNTQVNIFEITSGHHSLHNFEAYLINYKRLSLDSRVLARGANSAEPLTRQDWTIFSGELWMAPKLGWHK